MIVRAKDGQSLVDLALMTTGATEGVWALALRNGVSVTATLGYGSEIAWESEDIEDARTASRYETERIYPATEVSEAQLAELLNAPTATRQSSHEMIKADAPEPQSTKAAVFTSEFTAAFA